MKSSLIRKARLKLQFPIQILWKVSEIFAPSIEILSPWIFPLKPTSTRCASCLNPPIFSVIFVIQEKVGHCPSSGLTAIFGKRSH